MWCWRRMPKINWTVMKTNQEVIRRTRTGENELVPTGEK